MMLLLPGDPAEEEKHGQRQHEQHGQRVNLADNLGYSNILDN
jgi:hypothetical protein